MPTNQGGSSRRHGGRIHLHQRNVNDDAAIVGADILIHPEHRVAMKATEDNDISQATRRNYRNRVKEVYSFWRDEYPEFFDAATRRLTEDERTNGDIFYHTNEYDIIYSGFNVEMFKAFLSQKKQKGSGKLMTHGNIRKYKDAILYCANVVGENLPSSFYVEVEKFLKSFRKESAQAKKEGLVDEKEADPIPFSLFRELLSWALTNCNIYMWVFTILQWHCMARSVNIGLLGLHNFRVGCDSLVIKYDKSKTDQGGEKLHDKNIYANPMDPLVCSHLAISVWLALENAKFEDDDMFFQKSDDQDAVASSRYCEQLRTMIMEKTEQVMLYLRPKHTNSHGFRKGAATYVSAATTCPPPVSSIAARGEWSLGRILDLYWHFAEPGDHYLGRCISGIEPNSEHFGILPPHWVMDAPMEHPDVQLAMRMLYATILQKHGAMDYNVTGLLLRVLPSLVYHSSFLLCMIRDVPGHPFCKIWILQDPELLAQLKLLVTTDPVSTVTRATGIPPHIETSQKLVRVIDLCQSTLSEVKALKEEIKTAVSEAYEEKAEQQGHITGEKMQLMFTTFESRIQQLVTTQIDELRAALPPQSKTTTRQEGETMDGDVDDGFAPGEVETINLLGDDDNEGEPGTRQTRQEQYRLYANEGCLWDIPRDWELPKDSTLAQGWKMWLLGQPGNQTKLQNGTTLRAPVRPFRHLNPMRMSKNIRQQFRLHWKPIFSLMVETPGLVIPPYSDIDHDFVTSSYERAIEYLKTKRVSFIFENPYSNHLTWLVSTWSKNTHRSVILKKGNESDIRNLPQPTSHHAKPRTAAGWRRPLSTQAASRRVRRRPVRRPLTRRHNNPFQQRTTTLTTRPSGILPESQQERESRQREEAAAIERGNVENARRDRDGEISGVTDQDFLSALEM